MSGNQSLTPAAVLFLSGISSMSAGTSAADNQRPPESPSAPTIIEASKSGKEIFTMVSKPTTPIALLENIKVALDRHLLLREDFYTEENLVRFFGGTKVTWRVFNDPNRQWVFLSKFNQVVDALNSGEGISFSAHRTVKDGATEAGIRLGFMSSDARLKFEGVVEIFGAEWQPKWDEEEMRRWHHGGYKTPTHPHGNAAIQYITESANIKRTIVMHFSFNGLLERANFIEEK